MMSNTPQRLGKYELQDLLGRGGMAEVWKAFDVQLRRHVAIKLLHADLQSDPDFISRFTHEAQVVAALRHPNIVQIYDFHTSEQQESDNATAYMVMEYIQGKTLAHYIHTTSHKKNIPAASEVVRLFTPISLALDYAHRQGTVHRDIKPANILLDQTQRTRHPMGEPILSDFGLAKLLNTTSHTMGIFGTPLYMAPEQAQNKPVTSRTDLYALGVIYYEILTSAPPFQSDTLIGILMRHVNDEPPDPRTLNAQLPEAAVTVLRKALAKKPQERYDSASAMTVALAQAFGLAAPEDLLRNLVEPEEGGMTVYEEIASRPPGVDESYISRAEVPSGSQQDVQDEEDDPFSITVVKSTASSLQDQDSNSELLLPESEPPLSPKMGAHMIEAQKAGDIAAQQTVRSQFEARPVYPQAQGIVDVKGSQPRPRVINPVTPLPPVLMELEVRTALPAGPSTIVMIPSPPSVERLSFWQQHRTSSIIIVVLCLLFGSVLGAFLLLTHQSQVPVASTIVGQASFMSSGQTNPGTAQGINDEVFINLHDIPNPPAGKAYYAWLLEDKSQIEGSATALGMLKVNDGNVQKWYQEPQHTNLLVANSQILITEEDASVTPQEPTLDANSQVYSAEIPQNRAPGQQYSLLDHLRHLLAADPTLAKHHQAGGLDIWLQRNVLSIRDEAGTARDDWNTKDYSDAHKQIVEILDYLDGSAHISQDVPAHTPFVADTLAAQIGLLAVSSDANPAPYLPHIATHLNGIVGSPGVTTFQKNLAVQINVGLNFVTEWLKSVRQDALQLLHMDEIQLEQSSALALINDLAMNANYAYDGRTNPVTNAQQLGVNQICTQAQQMATFMVQQK